MTLDGLIGRALICWIQNGGGVDAGVDDHHDAWRALTEETNNHKLFPRPHPILQLSSYVHGGRERGRHDRGRDRHDRGNGRDRDYRENDRVSLKCNI